MSHNISRTDAQELAIGEVIEAIQECPKISSILTRNMHRKAGFPNERMYPISAVIDMLIEARRSQWIPTGTAQAQGILDGMENKRVMFMYEDGTVYRMDEDHPREKITHVCILPEFPVKEFYEQ